MNLKPVIIVYLITVHLISSYKAHELGSRRDHKFFSTVFTRQIIEIILGRNLESFPILKVLVFLIMCLIECVANMNQ